MWWRYNEWLGVRFRIHPLLTVFMFLSALTGRFIELIMLFGIVLIHELGHVAAARHFGWRVRDIVLTPFGGVAVTDEAGSVPAREEAVVALAGPAMNALMIAFAFVMGEAGIWTHAWKTYFVQANLTLMLFNLLPITPLDGGKLLHSGLSLLIPFYRTLKFTAAFSLLASSAIVGAAMSRLGAGGLELNLLLVGSFLMYSNWTDFKTAPYVFLRFLMHRGKRVAEWTRLGRRVSPITVRGGERLSAVVRLLMREKLHLIVILNRQGAVEAVVPELICTKHYIEQQQNRAVSELFM